MRKLTKDHLLLGAFHLALCVAVVVRYPKAWLEALCYFPVLLLADYFSYRSLVKLHIKSTESQMRWNAIVRDLDISFLPTKGRRKERR